MGLLRMSPFLGLRTAGDQTPSIRKASVRPHRWGTGALPHQLPGRAPATVPSVQPPSPTLTTSKS